jgi:hypothetical protein
MAIAAQSDEHSRCGTVDHVQGLVATGAHEKLAYQLAERVRRRKPNHSFRIGVPRLDAAVTIAHEACG